MSSHILVTGGSGYIGSHACVALLEAGHEVVVLDNLSNSSPVALERVQRLTGRSLAFERCDLRDRAAVEAVMARHPIDAVMHFAGLKAVGESCEKPLLYYENNVLGTIHLLDAMQKSGVRRMIFSSSATVYGFPEKMPIDEDAPLAAYNPYGRTKQIIEQMLTDLCRSKAGEGEQVVLLRYFNPVGAHESGDIGEDPNGIPNNLVPYVTQVAAGRREWLPVFGDDYPTPDGTGVRDYIHVQDLVHGHVLALEKLLALPAGETFCRAYNLGTGRGASVLQILRTFEQVNGIAIPHRIMPRRDGDVASCWADPARAREELGFEAKKDLAAMMADSWNWQRKNPDGYR